MFIALEGFVFTAEFGTKQPAIPVKKYALLVVLFFSTSVINNFALNFNISMPLHMIFRAGSLVANLILGIIILKRSYKLSKYFSVAMVTIGIATCTIMSSKSVQDTKGATGNLYVDYFWWCVGIGMLAAALLLSACLGIYQETLYTEHGKHPREAMFYAHALPLPIFLVFAPDIYKHILIFSASEPLVVASFVTGIPKLWVYLAGNMLTQYICIRSVYVLTSECTSLTVTLVITLRKFFNLLFSIFYFGNPFTVYHWIGTVLVFGGTLVFVEFFSKVKEALAPEKEKKVE